MKSTPTKIATNIRKSFIVIHSQSKHLTVPIGNHAIRQFDMNNDAAHPRQAVHFFLHFLIRCVRVNLVLVKERLVVVIVIIVASEYNRSIACR